MTEKKTKKAKKTATATGASAAKSKSKTAKPSKAKKTSAKKVAKSVNLKRQPVTAEAIIATMFYVGKIPFAPGTWGSLIGVLFFPVFLYLPAYVARGANSVLIISLFSVSLLVLLYAIGIYGIGRYQAKNNLKDASEIVYDEFFGQMLTYSLITAFYVAFSVIAGVMLPELNGAVSAVYFQFLPFAFFRLFDITKPWPIYLIDRKDHSARGVMLDDMVAAVYAALASTIVFLLASAYIIS